MLQTVPIPRSLIPLNVAPRCIGPKASGFHVNVRIGLLWLSNHAISVGHPVDLAPHTVFCQAANSIEEAAEVRPLWVEGLEILEVPRFVFLGHVNHDHL